MANIVNTFLRRTALALAGVSLLWPLLATAGTPLPVVEEPEHAEECVQPEEEMVRNHMNYILHQRDETMHRGIRTERYSLANCIDCHVQPNEDGHIARHDEKEHFCNGCHEYASVQIDCFECHADRPQKYIKRAGKQNKNDGEAEVLKQDLHNILLAHENKQTPEQTEAGQ